MWTATKLGFTVFNPIYGLGYKQGGTAKNGCSNGLLVVLIWICMQI